MLLTRIRVFNKTKLKYFPVLEELKKWNLRPERAMFPTNVTPCESLQLFWLCRPVAKPSTKSLETYNHIQWPWSFKTFKRICWGEKNSVLYTFFLHVLYTKHALNIISWNDYDGEKEFQSIQMNNLPYHLWWVSLPWAPLNAIEYCWNFISTYLIVIWIA